jgi:hypothetical protein
LNRIKCGDADRDELNPYLEHGAEKTDIDIVKSFQYRFVQFDKSFQSLVWFRKSSQEINSET